MRLSSFITSALCLLLQCRLSGCTDAESASVPAPISFQPSNYWDGNDGTWSTFAVQIGTPPQSVRLLPSITSNAIWTVWSYACEVSDLTNCPSARGDVFNISASSTWEDKGNFSLPLNPQHYLPYTGAAVVGFDNTTLDWQGHGGKPLTNQVIFAYATNDFYVGSIGLNPKTVNISSFNDQIPSTIGSLRQDNLIPSTSWGYLAGASYYSYPVSGFGSLTLGGYDASRLNVNANLTLAGGSDPYRPFLLGIESITTRDTEMLEEPIVTALDSLTTQIWLPISACQAFENAFNLVWNETYELYLLSEDEHSALVDQNASVTFTLSTGISDSTERLNITLPYAAFDLKASPPLAGSQTYFYFPLKRAANDTQYTLGRTILQEIYIKADFDRSSVTLYEASYPESSVESNIITICPPNSTTCISPDHEPRRKGNKLSVGATAGIVIAVVLLLSAISVAIWFKCFRKPPLPKPDLIEGDNSSPSRRTSRATNAAGFQEKPELGGEAVERPLYELDAYGHYKPEGHDSTRDSGYTSASPRGARNSSHGEFSPSAGPSGETMESGGREVLESDGREVQEMSAGIWPSTQPFELADTVVRRELPETMAQHNSNSMR